MSRLIKNFVGGHWVGTKRIIDISSPLTSQPIFRVCNTTQEELQPYITEMRSVANSGLHNPFFHKHRYLLYGDITRRMADALRRRSSRDTMANYIQQAVPKSDEQVEGEITVTQKFLENFSGDGVRRLVTSFGVPGDHCGQTTTGWRFPYGPVAIIAPFNFPLEIPALQLMGALFVGNKPLLHVDIKTASIMSYFIELLLENGMPPDDLVFVNGRGPVIQTLLQTVQPKLTQFTGSSRVGELLAHNLRGRVKLEDSGFDWKILAPDVAQFSGQDFRQVLAQCDRDAYEFGGQKCSAQSILFMHRDLSKLNIINQLSRLASRRNLTDLTNVPLLSVNNATITSHLDKLSEIPGTSIMFGGRPVVDSGIPEQYGCFEPTAVFVPIEQLSRPCYFKLATTEIFGPVQVVTEYDHIDQVLELVNKMQHHLTAAVVSSDIRFIEKVVGATVNGVTYVGQRARTTGAPQNHWFGPGGDPLAGSLGTPEAIQSVWTYHREIVWDYGSAE